MGTRVALAYALICAIWGSTWLAIKVALTGMPPLVGVGARFVIAGLFLYLVAAIVRPPAGERSPFSLIVVLAATLFGGNYAFTYFSETHLASGLAALIIPVIAVAIGIAVAHEPFGPRDVIGAILVIIGVGLSLTRRENAAALATATDTTPA